VPRQNRRRPQAVEPASAAAYLGAETVVEWAGEEYAVRQITGSASTKDYRCPGCDQVIRPATPHTVAWPVGDSDATHRRHWHTACWLARNRRVPRVARRRP
jgi:hypothetical protein